MTFLALWILVVCVVLLVISLFYTRLQWFDDKKRADTAEKAYSELTAQSTIRERTLIAERNHVSAAGGRIMNELVDAIRDADRLAQIVEQYIKDMDDTAELLKDANPPSLAAEREAIRLHHELLKSRTNETTN